MIQANTRGRLEQGAKKIVLNIFIYSILICICFLILYPLFSNISTMFKSRADLLDKSVVFLPKEPTTERIKQTLEGMAYGKVILNTTLLSGMVALLQVVSCTLIGYGFARFRFPGRRVLFAMVIFTMLVPVQLLMPSYYLQFQRFDLFGLIGLITGSPLRLLGTPWPFVLLSAMGLGFKNGLYIYFTRQFFINLPRELDESSRIDGAGFIRIFFQIMLPNALPVLITVFLFSFSWKWTDQYLTALYQIGRAHV